MLTKETISELSQTLPAIMTIKDLAGFLRCSEITIRRMIWEGQLRAYMADGEWNIARPDLFNYLQRHSNP